MASDITAHVSDDAPNQSPAPEQAQTPPSMTFDSRLERADQFWKDNSDWIEGSGFNLKPRPPYRKFLGLKLGKNPSPAAHDERYIISRDATCKRNGLPVVLVRPLPEEGPGINLKLSSESTPNLTGTPGNLFVALRVIGTRDQLMVFPRLRPFKNAERFRTGREFVTFFTRICEGIQFMHSRNVTYRDWTEKSIMVDSMDMKGLDLDRPRRIRALNRVTRIQAPRYYFIDLGMPHQPASLDLAPEHARENGERCDPCRTHMSFLGDLIYKHFMQKYKEFDFMQDLVDSMKYRDHERHARIEDVLKEFERIRGNFTALRLTPRKPTRFRWWLKEHRWRYGRRGGGRNV